MKRQWVRKIDLAFFYRSAGRKRTLLDVIVKFADWSSKQLIMANFREHGKLTVDGLDVQVYADLAPVTLQKIRDFKFLTDRLRQENIRNSGCQSKVSKSE